MKVENILGAVIAALILFISSMVTLFMENPELTFAAIKQSTWVAVLGGAGVAFLKDFQAVWTRNTINKVTGNGGSDSKSPAVIGVLALFLGTIAMTGCAGTSSAYKAAEGLSETAYVVGEHYYALVREANDLDDAGNLQANELQRLQTIARETRPTIVALLDAANSYDMVRSSANEAELTNAIADAAVAVSRLVDAIKAVGGSAHFEACLGYAYRAGAWPQAMHYCIAVQRS